MLYFVICMYFISYILLYRQVLKGSEPGDPQVTNLVDFSSHQLTCHVIFENRICFHHDTNIELGPQQLIGEPELLITLYSKGIKKNIEKQLLSLITRNIQCVRAVCKCTILAPGEYCYNSKYFYKLLAIGAGVLNETLN